MKLFLTVELEGQHFSGGVCCEIPELFVRCFEPLRTTDVRLLAYALGEHMANEEHARIVYKTRKDAADILSKEIAYYLVKVMSKNDTHNGYAKEAP